MNWIVVALVVSVLVSNVRWFVAHRQTEKTLQRALENGENWERLYHVARAITSRCRSKYQDTKIDNTRLRKELKQVKEKYRHAIADAVVFED